MTIRLIISLFVVAVAIYSSSCFNGDDFELECPDECDCHYFRINWVTDCSESNLTSIPYEELSLSVYILDLNGNNITKIEPFPKDIKLRTLILSNNFLTTINKESFSGLDYLIDVDLSVNNITAIDPESFIDSPGLLNIELHNNPLKYTDGPFIISKSLQLLDISYCNFSKLSTVFFENVTSLTTLDLSHNPLKHLDDGTFDSLTVLESLKLVDCQINSISMDSFAFLGSLKYLELSNNPLQNFNLSEVLGKLSRLEYLDLRNCSITSLSEETFDNCSYLTTLVLAENELKNLDVARTLGNSLQYLTSLDLSNCHIKGPLSEDAFANATRLKILNLSGNPLFASDLQIALEPLPRLERLYLSNCSLRRLPENFIVFKDLQELDISHNPLVDAFTRLISPLENLMYLNMGYSNLSYIGPDTFSNMTAMKRLVLSGNDLNSLEAGLFGNLTQLTTLELEKCGLKRPLHPNVFFKNLTYTDLREIKLAGNPIVTPQEGPLLPKQLSQITHLDLSNCNIKLLNEESFKLTKNITDLNLSGNNLTSDTLKFLQILTQLEKLDLNNNLLTTVNPNIFTKNPKIDTLKLLGNPFRCDCNIAEMWDWATMIKGDLSVLVGAKTSTYDIASRNIKRKKNLICHYDDKQLKDISNLNRTVPGRRPFIKPRELTAKNRTWAKYVRESGCESVVKISRPITMVPVALKAENEFIVGYKHTEQHMIIYSCFAMMVILFVVLISFMSVRYRLTRQIL